MLLAPTATGNRTAVDAGSPHCSADPAAPHTPRFRWRPRVVRRPRRRRASPVAAPARSTAPRGASRRTLTLCTGESPPRRDRLPPSAARGDQPLWASVTGAARRPSVPVIEVRPSASRPLRSGCRCREPGPPRRRRADARSARPPVSERRAEAVRHRGDAQVFDQLRVAASSVLPRTVENTSPSAPVSFPRHVKPLRLSQDLDRTAAQGYPVRPFRLQPPPRRVDALEPRRLVKPGGLKVVVEHLGCPMVRRSAADQPGGGS